MDKKIEKAFMKDIAKEKRVEFWTKFSLFGVMCSLLLIVIFLVYVKDNLESVNNFYNILIFIMFVISGIFASVLLFLVLKYSDDEDYSKYVVVEKTYLKELEKNAKRK